MLKEEGSSAADCVTDVTDRIPDYLSVLPSLGKRKKEETEKNHLYIAVVLSKVISLKV